MPNSLSPIPLKTQIVEPKSGGITIFFRQAWEGLRTMVGVVPTVGAGYDASNVGAAIVSQLAFTVVTSGRYRVSYYIRKTIADGVSSSVQFSWSWTESGIAQTLSDVALTTDTTGAVIGGDRMLIVDANSQLTFSVAYASNTPAKMRFTVSVRVELMN